MLPMYPKISDASGKPHNWSVSSAVIPADKDPCNCPMSSKRTITPYLAFVSDRAESSTPCSTEPNSRLSLILRLALLSRDRRSRNSAISRSLSLCRFIYYPLTPHSEV